jgi:type IV pilus assembly protein PilA
VLAILAAIAIPSFTSINNKARASAAANVVATTAKQCAVKYANGETTAAELAIPEVSLNSYTSLTINNSLDTCAEEGEIVAESSDESRYPTFTYNIETGDKTCTYTKAGATEAEEKAVGCVDSKW